MCGIFGFSGKKKANPHAIRIGLVANQTRGKQGTGVYGKQLYKSGQKAEEFIKSSSFNNAVDSVCVVGHTRHATCGPKDRDGAHPFVFTDNDWGHKIAGTHNGFILNMDEVADDFKLDKTEVDSEFIFKFLAHVHGDFTQLSNIEGTMALAFIIDKKLYLYRRKSKPMFIAETPEGIYYSSIKDPFEVMGIHERDIWTLPTDVMFTFDKGILVDEQPINKPEVDFNEFTTFLGWVNQIPWSDRSKYSWIPSHKKPSTGSKIRNWEDYEGIDSRLNESCAYLPSTDIEAKRRNNQKMLENLKYFVMLHHYIYYKF